MKNLITFEEALEKALEFDPELNEYQEYNDGWAFSLNDGELRVGGPHSGIVITKSGGNRIRPYEYFMSDKYIAEPIGEAVKIEK